jgi:hypothetical protein
MQILPSSLISAYIKAVELNGQAVNATFVDMETGRVQHWVAGSLVEAKGEVRILLEAKQEKVSLDPVLSNELDKLLEQAKQRMARMSPEARRAMYEEQKKSLARALSTPCEHGGLDFEQCPACRNPSGDTQ